MKVAVRYYSRSGNTKKLAEEIAKTAGVTAETTEQPLGEPVDLLFLGSAVYAAGVDEHVKSFLRDLDPAQVKKIVNFSTAALLPGTYAQVSKLAAERGLPLAAEEFHCRGRFSLLHRDRPNAADLAEARAFAEKLLERD
jgi:flavodoxin